MSTVMSEEYVPEMRAVVGTPHPALRRQQQVADDRTRVLRRAQASGHRLVSALYLVLARHEAESVVTETGEVHLRCVECRPGPGTPDTQYPCPTAEQALWALDAVLG